MSRRVGVRGLAAAACLSGAVVAFLATSPGEPPAHVLTQEPPQGQPPVAQLTDGVGCIAHTSREQCVGKRDGRSFLRNVAGIYQQPCVWCCGEPCIAGDPHVCQPKGYLLREGSGFTGKWVGAFADYCTDPSSSSVGGEEESSEAEAEPEPVPEPELRRGVGCSSLRTREECLAHRDGSGSRCGAISRAYGQPCSWCCGDACGPGMQSRCMPRRQLLMRVYASGPGTWETGGKSGESFCAEGTAEAARAVWAAERDRHDDVIHGAADYAGPPACNAAWCAAPAKSCAGCPLAAFDAVGGPAAELLTAGRSAATTEACAARCLSVSSCGGFTHRHLDCTLHESGGEYQLSRPSACRGQCTPKTPPTPGQMNAFLSGFLARLRRRMSLTSAAPQAWAQYVDEARNTLEPVEARYRSVGLFPVRSGRREVFVSVAAYREHTLADLLKRLYDAAERPDSISVGLVMQYCVRHCKTGVLVLNPGAANPRTAVKDAPPDVDGHAEFCADPAYARHCKSGRVRLLRVEEPDTYGPAVARYLAAKLWRGEEFFVQIDSHLHFDKDWDARMRKMLELTGSAKPVLSVYPPSHRGAWQRAGPVHMCGAMYGGGADGGMLRILAAEPAKPTERPTYAPFVAAGFFAAPAAFMQDVPFDPYQPWLFMGEELSISLRLWTSGWDIYAPHQNLFAHEYRPGHMGLPKFWETVNRVFECPLAHNSLTRLVECRVKGPVGYPECMDGVGKAVAAVGSYGPGSVRSLQKYLEVVGIDIQSRKAARIRWCAESRDPPEDGWQITRA